MHTVILIVRTNERVSSAWSLSWYCTFKISQSYDDRRQNDLSVSWIFFLYLNGVLSLTQENFNYTMAASIML